MVIGGLDATYWALRIDSLKNCMKGTIPLDLLWNLQTGMALRHRYSVQLITFCFKGKRFKTKYQGSWTLLRTMLMKHRKTSLMN